MERKIGLIPKVMVQGALGPKEYGILVTDQRTIFVLERKTNAMVGGIVGGAIGAIIADSLTATERKFDYESESPENLAADEKNMVVVHSQLEQIRLKNGFSGCSLMMKYVNQDGKSKKITAMMTPPQELVARRKGEGVKRKEVLADYARAAQKVFELALPPSVAQRGEWRI